MFCATTKKGRFLHGFVWITFDRGFARFPEWRGESRRRESEAADRFVDRHERLFSFAKPWRFNSS
jgi:hypothetical protein